MKKVIPFLLAILFLTAAGCGSNAAPEGQIQIVDTAASALKVGELSDVPLEAAGDTLRCARTGRGYMAETDSGYYFLMNQILYYADKSDLSTWVPVCDKPNCLHNGADCNAYINSEFTVSGDRIYFCGDSYDYGIRDRNGRVLASMALDGNDRKLAYTIEGALLSNGGIQRLSLMYNQLVACFAALQEDGTYSTQIVRLDEDGEHVLFTGTTEEDLSTIGIPAAALYNFYGDPAIFTSILGESSHVFDTLYCPTQDGLLELDGVNEFELTGAYLSGYILRTFIQDDGYYDADLSSGETVKVADAQLDGSWSFTLQPNCVVESTLFADSKPFVGDTELICTDPAMVLYDGTAWRAVALPEDLLQPDGGGHLFPAALTSDRIFFQRTVDGTVYLYQILLGTEEPSLTLCGVIG